MIGLAVYVLHEDGCIWLFHLFVYGLGGITHLST